MIRSSVLCLLVSLILSCQNSFLESVLEYDNSNLFVQTLDFQTLEKRKTIYKPFRNLRILRVGPVA